MLGRRIPSPPHSWDAGQPPFRPGDYWKEEDTGLWMCVAPSAAEDWQDWFMGSLGDGQSHHKVVEHEDGTITVSPSILITHPHKGTSWHGFLERGVWREC